MVYDQFCKIKNNRNVKIQMFDKNHLTLTQVKFIDYKRRNLISLIMLDSKILE